MSQCVGAGVSESVSQEIFHEETKIERFVMLKRLLYCEVCPIYKTTHGPVPTKIIIGFSLFGY